MSRFTILKVESDYADLHDLIRRLDEDLLERYPADQIYLVDFSNPKVKNMIFAVVYMDGKPVACGGLRPIDTEEMELKRFYVDSSYRRQGIAVSLLSFLEEEARKRGVVRINLETGAAQPEAIAFYTKQGYEPIERFGEYEHDENSLCYGKKLSLSL
ncbi:GNAT family N-acetyltransferase [Paenibacillus polymyxa]|uniref:GNAT family N-acetyltransferase n=1 Tax=Paenibacillus polymyxa TaxID=1406 RepID=UPI0002E0452D|nr:GNAT family N-acetyltransferase [Paenibacillus polymyxa]KAE8558218.1 GNAT family N-acetyltransferase [Paenibacillus polymyxa]MCJ1222990.1 GNAT family N-acetyltransferase [Paenibacillus polymyxa]NMP09953.1 GNAT family N-acetyltransferase [Paenibacillus polymyxa]